MKNLIVYGRTNPPCSACSNVKAFLDTKGIVYSYKDVSISENFDEFCKYRLRTIPAIFKDGIHLGGFEEIKVLLKGE